MNEGSLYVAGAAESIMSAFALGSEVMTNPARMATMTLKANLRISLLAKESLRDGMADVGGGEDCGPVVGGWTWSQEVQECRFLVLLAVGLVVARRESCWSCLATRLEARVVDRRELASSDPWLFQVMVPAKPCNAFLSVGLPGMLVRWAPFGKLTTLLVPGGVLPGVTGVHSALQAGQELETTSHCSAQWMCKVWVQWRVQMLFSSRISVKQATHVGGPG